MDTIKLQCWKRECNAGLIPEVKVMKTPLYHCSRNYIVSLSIIKYAAITLTKYLSITSILLSKLKTLTETGYTNSCLFTHQIFVAGISFNLKSKHTYLELNDTTKISHVLALGRLSIAE